MPRTLLRRGVSILDTVHEAGYFDQAHTDPIAPATDRETPARLRVQARQLSFLSTGQARCADPILGPPPTAGSIR